MKYNRWFPCSQDINSDPNVNELCIKFGVSGLRIWLELQSISDRNEGTVPGNYEELMRPLSGRCQTTNRRVIEVLEWLNSRLMIEGQSPVRVSNYWDFHRNRVPNSQKKDGELGTPLPNLPTNQPNTNTTLVVLGDEAQKKHSRKSPKHTPETIEVIREITLRYPPKRLWPALEKEAEGITRESLDTAYTAWTMRGYSPTNYSWLKWARNGEPTNGSGANGKQTLLHDALDYLRGGKDNVIDITPKH